MGQRRETRSRTATPPPHHGYRFPNEYIDEHGVLDEGALAALSCQDQIGVLEDVKTIAAAERDGYSSSYELQKSRVASIYGGIGLLAPVCAALVTSGIRSTLLQAAQYAVGLGYVVYYMDTDALFIKHPTVVRNISPELNRQFPHTEIEMKTYGRVWFLQKKTYYSIEDGVLKYFQNVNGNPEWRNFVWFVYEQRHVADNQGVLGVFVDFFNRAYDRLEACGETVDGRLTDQISQHVKIKASYKTNTHLSKFKDYLRENYPAMAGSFKHTVYYEIDADVKAVRFRPIEHFTDVSQLKTVNLFKFYQNMFKTVFNIIKFHVRKNNEPFTVTMSARPVLLTMIRAFLEVHRTRFPDVVRESTINVVDSMNIEEGRIADDFDYITMDTV